MFDFDVNAVAAACEAALEQELVRMDKGYYIIDDEVEAFELEDEAEEIDAVYHCLLENTDDGSRAMYTYNIYTLKEVLEIGGSKLIEKVRVENGY